MPLTSSMNPEQTTRPPPSKKSARKAPDAPASAAATAAAAGAAPRKRRRRAVASGAPDDCFACAKRGARCDRRRPYCSQCLELGRECSGYKTKLTWDVGVASRGKLRGLSLPVMGAKPAQDVPPTDHTSTSGGADDQAVAMPTLLDAQRSPTEIASPETTRPAAAVSRPVTNPEDSRGYSAPIGRGTPQNFSTNTAVWATTPPDEAPMSSPTLLSSTGGMLGYHELVPPHLHRPIFPTVPRASFTASEAITSVTPYPVDGFGTIIAGEQWPPNQDDEEEEIYREDRGSIDSQLIPGLESSLWTMGHTPSYSQMLLARSVGRTPRLKYLISYYAEVIAPVIVAFDGPTNPFRTYILSLAQESESLQEAIATLSSSNMKQRRMRNTMSKEKTLPARMSSIAHRALTDREFQDRCGITIEEGFNREELHHRGLAVRALNAQLADPNRRLSDSVLATLLILCLYHVCDTGVAQFKTQFEGVRKLLAMRMRNLRFVSEELKWFIRIFTWFDTMTATINDREVQLRGICLDTTATSDGEWSLENIVGIDAGLFKLIAQLGRLNLLSQRKPLRSPAPADVHMPTTTLPPSMLPYTAFTFDPNSALWNSGVVNPFGFPYPAGGTDNQHSGPTSHEFWSEWYSLRQRLESWRLDTTKINIPPPPSSFSPSSAPPSLSPCFPDPAVMSPPSSPTPQFVVAPQHVEDLFNISESFRQSALLYTERLAYPNLPSSHPRIQNIVRVALKYIAAVQSDVYLLWPLFITGSECVLDEHRAMIRSWCSGIENDSGFFNNLSCLELLERIWAQNPTTHASGNGNEASSAAGINAAAATTTYPANNNTCAGDVMAGAVTAAAANAPGFKWQHILRTRRDGEEYMVV